MAKQKYYVVWEGTDPGVYDNWQDTLCKVKGFPGARYKSFATLAEARNAYSLGYDPQQETTSSNPKKPGTKGKNPIGTEVLLPAWAVDAACSGVPGPLEYRGVDLASGQMLFHKGPYAEGTNNIGEFLAIVHALALLHKQADSKTAIYTDSRTALSWLKQKKAKTTLKPSFRNKTLFELLHRAEVWLKTHKYTNKVIKWNTKAWGEIPADFGRK